MNSTLKSWLKELGFDDFVHAQVTVTSICPIDINKSAEHIISNYGKALVMFSVGRFADRVLTAASLPHGAFPPTTANKLEVQKAMFNCKTYLAGVYNHVQTNSPTQCS